MTKCNQLNSKLSFNRRSYYDIGYIVCIPFANDFDVFEVDQTRGILVETFSRLSKEKDICLIDSEVTSRYVRFKFSCVPNIDLSKFINSYKAVSSRYIRSSYNLKIPVWQQTNLMMSIGSEGEALKKIDEFMCTCDRG